MQIMGDQASINGRDRGNGFRDCITKNYPKLKLLEVPTKAWSGEDAAAGLDAILNATPGSQGDLHARRRRVPGADAADAEAQGHAQARPASRATSSSSAMTASRRNTTRSARAKPTRPSRSRPISTPSTGCMYLKQAIAGKTFAAGPDRPRQHHRPGRARRARGPARGAARSPRRTSTTRRSGATSSRRPCSARLDRDGAPQRAVDAPPIVEAIGVSKRYGATVALSDARIRVVPGESPCAGRAQRRGQVDPGRHPHRASHAGQRRGSLLRRAGAAGRGPRGLAQAGRLRLPAFDDHPGPDGRRESVRQPPAARGAA